MATGDDPTAARRHAYAARKPLRDRGDVSLDRVLAPSERAPQPLPHREHMEQLFRTELSQVRAYTGAAHTLDPLGARAAASGEQVAFAETQPSASTVAHEVTHVLQARADGSAGGDAEAEASRNEAVVGRGDRGVAVAARARGVHFDDKPQILQLNEQALDPAIRDRLAQLPILDGTPLGKYITSGEDHATANWAFSKFFGEALGLWQADAVPSKILDRLVGPDTFAGLLSRGSSGLPTAVPLDASDGAFWEITNTLVKRAYESLPRVLPYVAFLKKATPFSTVDTTNVPAMHPMDHVVAAALSVWNLSIAEDYFIEHPTDVKAPPAPLRTGTKLEPARGTLWHWVVAAPSDATGPAATAQEVALVLFGNADLAYRLVPAPPRWGFHHADLQLMPDEPGGIRDQLVAWGVNHGHKVLLNAGDIYGHRRPVPVHPRNFDRCGSVQQDPNFELSRHLLGEDQMVEPPAPAAIWGLKPGNDDPVLELTRAEEVPLPETPTPDPKATAPRVAHDTIQLSEKLRDADRLFAQIIAAVPMFNLSADTVLEMRAFLDMRRQYALRGFLSPDVDKWFLLTAKQIPILRTVAYGLANLMMELASYNKADPGAAKPGDLIRTLPAFTREPMQDSVQQYVDAVQALDLPEVARARARSADDLMRNVTIATLERGIHESGKSNDVSIAQNSIKGPDAEFIDPFKKLADAQDMTARLAKLRIMQVSDPEQAAMAMIALRREVGDFQFTVAIEQAVKQLDGYWEELDGANTIWATIGDDWRTQTLKAENRAFFHMFRDGVYKIYMGPDGKGTDENWKTIARANFTIAVTNPRWNQHFKDVEELINDEASHARWTKLIAAIAICVVSMGVAAEVGLMVGAEGLGWGATATTLATVAADTGTMTFLNYEVLGIKPTIGGTIAQIVTFGGMSAIQRVRAVARAAGVAEEAEEAIKASFLVKAGRASVDFAKEAFLNVAVGQASNMLANRIDTGSWIDADTAPDSMVDGAITAVALTIAGRLHSDLIMEPRYRKAALRFGVDLDAVYTERLGLIDEATKLKGSTDREAAIDVVERLNKNLDREKDLRKRLNTVAKLQPKAYKDAMGELAERTMEDLQTSQKDVEQAASVIGLEDLGPGLARADSRTLDSILTGQHKEGGRVVKVETDPDTHLRTVTIEAAGGGRLEIREQPLPAAERKAPKLATETAREFESWLDDSTRDPALAQRLRDLYVIDPATAIATAAEHGYAGKQPEKPLADEATRARDAARKLDDPNVRELTNPDFSALERAGYHYDPVSRRFVEIAKTRSGLRLDAHLPGRVNEVIGQPLPSPAVGMAVLQLLSMGDAHALRVVGIEPPPEFKSGTGEWGLGRRTSDGAIVLVRGEAAGVHWGNVPGIEPLAHSHPYRDNKYFQIGGKPEGKVALADLIAGRRAGETLKIFPSGADFLFAAHRGLESHFVVTPYVDLGNGMIGNPRPGGLETPIVIEIRMAKHVGAEGGTGAPTVEAEIIIRSGDKELMRRSMWGGQLGNYMPVGFEPPSDLKFGPQPAGPKPGSTLAPTPIDPAEIKAVAKTPGLPKELKNAIQSEPRVQRALHNDEYDPQRLIEAWDDFQKGSFKSDTFGEYLKQRPDFLTTDGEPAERLSLTDVFKNWGKLRSNWQRNWAIVSKAEPELAKTLEDRGGMPPRIKRAIKNLLDNKDLLGRATSWEGGRHAVMGKIDEIIARMATPGELGTIIKLLGSSGRIGTIGEQFVQQRLSSKDFAENDLYRQRFAKKEIPGLTGVETFSPDVVVQDAGRTLDVKTGYADADIDPQQAKNYNAFIDAVNASSDLQGRVGGRLSGHDYLFLPGGSKDPAIVAKEQYETIKDLGLTKRFRVLYLGSDGAIYQYRPNGSERLGTTIHEAMGLSP